jgi:hypothetical protein
VGTVVRTGEDEDPIAVMTVLNTQQHKQAGFMSQIWQYMLAKCKDTAVKDKLAQVRRAAAAGQTSGSASCTASTSAVKLAAGVSAAQLHSGSCVNCVAETMQ